MQGFDMGSLLSCGLNWGPPECVVGAGYNWAMRMTKNKRKCGFTFFRILDLDANVLSKMPLSEQNVLNQLKIGWQKAESVLMCAKMVVF